MRSVWLVLSIMLLALSTPGTGSCGPLLNEILADPASDWDGNGAVSYRDDEWVEIVNTGPGSCDLSGYLLADDLRHPVYGFSGTLGEGSVAVVYGSQATAWESAHGQTATGLRLGNDGDTVLLMQVAGADTVLVDAYTYNTYEAENDRSSGRYPDGGVWEMFDGLNPYSGTTPPPGNGLNPTPGSSNTGAPPQVPADVVSWGRVKSLYARD
jgi:hypothetical protein